MAPDSLRLGISQTGGTQWQSVFNYNPQEIDAMREDGVSHIWKGEGLRDGGGGVEGSQQGKTCKENIPD